MDLILEGEQLEGAKIELLIKLLAATRATADMVIELSAKSEQEKDEFIKLYDEQREKYAQQTKDSLFERRGSVNLGDILGTPNGL